MNSKATDVFCEVDSHGLGGVHVELHADAAVEGDRTGEALRADSNMSSLAEIGGLHYLYPASRKAGGVTRLLLDAEELGIPCANGLTMLVAQGLRAAEQFPDITLGDVKIDDVCNSLLNEQKNIVLIGMPGCGKSTVGKILSEKLNREIIDTDEEIIKADGRTIPEIFSTDGEKIFREIETNSVKSVGKQLGKIIATGGGAVMKKENRDALGQNGTVIYLKKDLSLLSLDGRPLSKDEDAVRKIYEARKDTYEAFADFTVEVDADAQITAERVIECIF
jgi:shikimate dehydrogenase